MNVYSAEELTNHAGVSILLATRLVFVLYKSIVIRYIMNMAYNLVYNF